MPAQHQYNAAALENILSSKGINNSQFAELAKVSPEHVADVLSGKTKYARRDTRRKFEAAALSVGATQEQIAALFS